MTEETAEVYDEEQQQLVANDEDWLFYVKSADFINLNW